MATTGKHLHADYEVGCRRRSLDPVARLTREHPFIVGGYTLTNCRNGPPVVIYCQARAPGSPHDEAFQIMSDGAAITSPGFSGTRFTVSCMHLIDHTALYLWLLENEA